MKSSTYVALLSALLIAGWASLALGQHDHGKHEPSSSASEQMITGQVVDVACFVGHNSSGPKHAKCAETCARAGNPLAIYDEKAKAIYLPVSSDHSNPNTKLMPFIEKRVKVSGKILEKAGLKGIAIEKVVAE
ncbi:MAG: hypothetical protein NW208_18650 [Bryobacter sp.]|nr:hypothetical protein [Bryobacter sp.]